MNHKRSTDTFPELAPGTVVLDSRAARLESVVGQLKHGTGRDRHVILIPQPTNAPEDPLNFSLARKLFILSITGLGISIFAGTVGPLLNSGLAPISDDLDTSVANIAKATGYQTITVAAWSFFVNAGAAKWGKRPAFLLSGMFNLVGSSIGAVSTTYNQLLAARIVQGLSVSAYESLVFSMIGDLFFVHERGRYVSVVSFLLAGVSNLSPVISGSVTARLGWKWLFKLLILLGGLQTLLQFLFVPETQYHRQSFVTSDTVGGDVNPNTITSTTSESVVVRRESISQRHEIAKSSTVFGNLAISTGTFSDKGFLSLLLNPIAVLLNCAVLWSILVSAFYFSLYITVSTLLSQTFSAPPYNLDASGVGYLSLGPFVGGFLAGLIAGIINDPLVRWCARKNNGVFEPEYRLLMMILGVFTFPGLIGFGYVVKFRKSCYAAASLFGLGLFGIVFVLVSTSNYVLDANPEKSNEIFIAAMAIKNILIYGYSYFINEWAATEGVIKVLWIYCIIAAGLLVTVPLMFIYGKKIRLTRL